MVKFTQFMAWCMAFCCCHTALHAQISGVVFKDFNASGVKDNTATFNEPFVQNVTVKVTLPSGSSFTTTTDANGAYSFTAVQVPSTTQVRVEFTDGESTPSSAVGAGNASSVQFVTAPSTTVNYAINSSDDFWDNVKQPDPLLIMPVLMGGTNTGSFKDRFSLVQLNNNVSGITSAVPSTFVIPNPSDTSIRPALTSQTGSLWGEAYQKKVDRFFHAAVLKRQVGVGPRGLSGIYITEKSGANYALSASFSLQGVTPANTSGSNPALDFGAVTRSSSNFFDNNFLTSTPGNPNGDNSYDIDAFDKVGRVGIGDIDVDEKNNRLFIVNLNQRSLVTVDISSTTSATLNNAMAATLAPLTNAYPMQTLPGWPTNAVGVNGSYRPWGIKIYKGKGYIGVVNDGSVAPPANPVQSDVKARILSFDVNNITAGFTTEVVFDMSTANWKRNRFFGSPATSFQLPRWYPWVRDYEQVRSFDVIATPNPQPVFSGYIPQAIIADIDFAEDGSMLVAFADRYGFQGNGTDFAPVSSSSPRGTTFAAFRSEGDLLKVCKTSGGWVVEGAATSCTQSQTSPQPSYNNTSKEFFFDQSGDDNDECAEGAIATLMGSYTTVMNVIDPFPAGTAPASAFFRTQGIQFVNNTTGNKTKAVRLVAEINNFSAMPQILSRDPEKGNGMGDIEYALCPQPIQVGNRIWLDRDQDGVQDPNEPPLAGITVALTDDMGNVLARTVTDANGNYYFTKTNINSNGATGTTQLDTRRPAIWSGVATDALLPGFNYQIRVDNTQAALAGYSLTTANASTNSVDNIDSDANLVGNVATVLFNTSDNNHSYDIGYNLASLGDKVWRDDDKDGIQDAGEPGVAGITVTLFRNGGLDGNPATTADNNIPYATTTTDAYGMYLFEDLPAGTYEVGFTLPSNYTFTTQTNTTDNTVVTGGSTAVNGSDANVGTGRTGAIVLSAGEKNRDVDAGIIFTTPTKQSLGDRVWLDTDKDGIQDSGENGIAGVTVSLYRATGPDGIAGNADDALPYLTTLTDATGNYLFDNIPVGTYEVGFTAPVGYIGSPQTNTTDNTVVTGGSTAVNGSDANVISGRTGNIVISANENNRDVDAGFYPQDVNNASLGNVVWYDVDQDGIQDTGEPGVAGVLVELLDGANNPIYVNAAGAIVAMGAPGAVAYTAITNALGKYQFNNLLANVPYKVKFNPPAGYTVSSSNVGTNDYVNSDAGRDGVNTSQQVILSPGQHNPSIDAGMYQSGANTRGRLGDKVWFDNNKNGLQDGGEAGVPGVTVNLYTNGADGIPGNADDVFVGTTVTDAEGMYQFVNLNNGSYNVGFTNIPAGYSFTTQAADANTVDGSDVNPLTGRTTSASFTISGATVISTVDAGIVPGVPSGLGSLGNRVWYDVDGDGIQDVDELGVQGVTVNLYKDLDGDGNISGSEYSMPFASTTTNGLGEYMFGGLDRSVYQIGFTNIPAGYMASPKDVTASGGNEVNDSDGYPISSGTSFTDFVYLSQGEDKLTVDLGIVPPANTNRLSGTVWFDTDKDGSQTNNSTIERVPGVTVTLYNSSGQAISTTVTDSLGNYQFIGMADGSYSVGFGNYPAGYVPTLKSATNDATGSDVDNTTNRTVAVSLGVGNRDNTSLDAGLVTSRAALGNYVWFDEDSDGVQDAAELGIPGVTVTLYRPGVGLDGIAGNGDDALPVATMITDANGKYYFANLEPGTYEVGFGTAPNGLVFTKQNTPGDNQNNTNSDAVPLGSNPSMARTGSIVLSAGEVDNTIDAGLTRYTASVGNYVWVDLPGGTTSVQDPSEPGVGGVLVTLKDSGGNVIGTAITDADGKYLITNVPPGTGYTITFSGIPTGTSYVAQNSGGNAALDSDANPATGVTSAFSVAAGQFVNNIDAGLIIPYTLALTIQDFAVRKLGNYGYITFTVSERIVGATYSIERSVNGNNNFISIMQFAGGSNAQFSFEDVTLQKNVTNYYRIKEVLPNGKVNYSYIKSIILNSDNDISVYPIPAIQTLQVACNSSWLNQKAIIKLYSIDGRAVLQRNVEALSSVETIDISKVSNGTYSLYMYINGVFAKAVQVIIAR